MEVNFTIRVPVAQGETFPSLLGVNELECRVEGSGPTSFVEWTRLCGDDTSLLLNESIKVTPDPSNKTAPHSRCSGE
jgi:hypothetical protein